MLTVEPLVYRLASGDVPDPFGRWVARYAWSSEWHQWTAVDSDPLVAVAMAIQKSAEQMEAVARVEAERKAAKEKPCRTKKSMSIASTDSTTSPTGPVPTSSTRGSKAGIALPSSRTLPC